MIDKVPGELRIENNEKDLFDDSNVKSERQPNRLAEPIVRSDARSSIELMGGVTWSRLTPGAEVKAEFLEICYEVGANSGPTMSHHLGREFGIILEGELTLDLGFERFHLRQGDSIIFDSTLAHRLSNEGAVPLRGIWVIFDHH
jgi:mannose-6-phosphate isomerase-like protein (cupin superfamily)